MELTAILFTIGVGIAAFLMDFLCLPRGEHPTAKPATTFDYRKTA